MIISIRGTHGSGKSTVVAKFKNSPGLLQTITRPGRKRPIGYILQSIEGVHYPMPPTMKKVFIPGHYETPCGGCDTIAKVYEAYDLIVDFAVNGYDVVYEGILVQHSNGRAIELFESGLDLRVLYLDIDENLCAEAVEKRREDRGNFDFFDPKNVFKETQNVAAGIKRLQKHGVPVIRVTRENAVDTIKKELGWHE